MSFPRAFGLIAMLCLVGVPSAGAQLPVGEADGVRIFKEPGEMGEVVIRFTPRAEKLRRRLAGRLITVFCTDLPPPGRRGAVVTATGEDTYRFPKRGRTLRTGDLSRGLDYCHLSLGRHSRERLVSIPLTQVGAVYLDEDAKATALLQIVIVAGAAAEKQGSEAYPTHAQLVEFLTAQSRGLGPERVVALAGPADTPPAGKLGYWSDAAEHVVVVIVSRSGRRLFLEFEPDGVVRTNVAGYIYGDLEP